MDGGILIKPKALMNCVALASGDAVEDYQFLKCNGSKGENLKLSFLFVLFVNIDFFDAIIRFYYDWS